MSDTLKFTLKYPLTQEDINLITDAEFEHSDTIWFVTPKGKSVEFRKVVKGEWIPIGEPDKDNNQQVECSNCHAGDLHAVGVEVPYCWRCGARMGEE